MEELKIKYKHRKNISLEYHLCKLGYKEFTLKRIKRIDLVRIMKNKLIQ